MYVATINVPGYLPMDDEPPMFDTAREAWQYLVGEVERQWDEYPEDVNGACVEAHTAMHNQDQDQEGTVYAPTPGYEGDHDLGLAYSVTRVSGEVVLRETTHHGDYRHQRDVTLPRAFTGEDVARMAQECPYVYVLSPERAEALAEALNTYNRAEHGWTTWEVVSIDC